MQIREQGPPMALVKVSCLLLFLILSGKLQVPNLEVSKAIVKARMLSGRYRTESLCHYLSSNPPGWCLSGICHQTEEALEHILIECPAYSLTRRKLLSILLSEPYEAFSQLLRKTIFKESIEEQLHFLSVCSTVHYVIKATQVYGLFHLTKTWCFSVHCDRLRILGRWNPQLI